MKQQGPILTEMLEMLKELHIRQSQQTEYWTVYTNLAQLYHMFDQAFRANDFRTFKYAEWKMTAIFFP